MSWIVLVKARPEKNKNNNKTKQKKKPFISVLVKPYRKDQLPILCFDHHNTQGPQLITI